VKSCSTACKVNTRDQLLSRDRQGAVALRRASAPLRSRLRRGSGFSRRQEYRRGIALLSDNVLNRCRDVLWFPQPSRAAMACPALPIGIIQPHPIQTASGISLEGVHNPLRPNLRCHHGVHLAASHMGRYQGPAPVFTYLLNRLQDSGTPDRIQVIGRLIHQFQLRCGTRGIRFEKRTSRKVILTVDRARFAAMQMSSVANKRDQENHRLRPNLPLRLKYSYARIFLTGSLVGAGVLPRSGPARILSAPLQSRLSKRCRAPAKSRQT
jgi:hypothetical protein